MIMPIIIIIVNANSVDYDLWSVWWLTMMKSLYCSVSTCFGRHIYRGLHPNEYDHMIDHHPADDDHQFSGQARGGGGGGGRV